MSEPNKALLALADEIQAEANSRSMIQGHVSRHEVKLTEFVARLRALASSEPGFTCSHQPYQGACIHCDVTFKDGRPVYPATQPEQEAFRVEVERIAGDYCPDRDEDAPLALCEMRAALLAALRKPQA